jgi:hypothetical protein
MLTLRTLSDSTNPSVAAARALLIKPSPRDATLLVLGAAALCAACAVALAGSVVLGPPMQPHGGDTPAVRGSF